MDRTIQHQLKAWKNNDRRKPLILRGARQVGKTWSIKQFGKSEFENCAYIDFERTNEIRRVFGETLDPKKILSTLELITSERIIPGRTLLVFDEIQACPRAITGLRYFYEEVPDLHVIAAGSLLEFALKEVSFPVGRVQFLHQYPLTFAEYLIATNHAEAADLIQNADNTVSPVVHDFLINELRRYFFIGGMPEAVLAFVETGSLHESFRVQEEIVETYRLDFAKYSPRVDKHCLNAVLSSGARSIGKQTKYSKLAEGYANATIKNSYEILCLAGIFKKISSTIPSGLPLEAGASSKVFKTIMVDIGLLRYFSGMPADIEYSAPNILDIYRGAMAEQFAGQEIAAAQGGELYYWARQEKSSSAEVDYIAVVNGSIIPIEIKSGASGRLKSMHLFLKIFRECKEGLVFSSNPASHLPDQKLRFLPLYFLQGAMKCRKVVF